MRRVFGVFLSALLGVLLIGPASAGAVDGEGSGDPFGNLERVIAVEGGIEVKGWAIDPDTAAPIYVWVTIDGAGRHLYADVSRPDVAAAYPGSGPDHGFRGTMPASAGRHSICLTASNVGPGTHTGLGCRTLSVTRSGSPFGNFEAARAIPGSIEIKGWAIDPDTTAPIYVWVTVDGAGRHLLADRWRGDVFAAFDGYGGGHGFGATLVVAPGKHRVCVTAANVSYGRHTPLGCRTVSVDADPDAPFGHLDQVYYQYLSNLRTVRGWAIDPDTRDPIYVWLTVDGVGQHAHASWDRPDVGAAFPAFGPNHGFVVRDVPQGELCVYASNVGPGSHTLLGCR